MERAESWAVMLVVAEMVMWSRSERVRVGSRVGVERSQIVMMGPREASLSSEVERRVVGLLGWKCTELTAWECISRTRVGW